MKIVPGMGGVISNHMGLPMYARTFLSLMALPAEEKALSNSLGLISVGTQYNVCMAKKQRLS